VDFPTAGTDIRTTTIGRGGDHWTNQGMGWGQLGSKANESMEWFYVGNKTRKIL
jgi:hypothetical protein